MERRIFIGGGAAAIAGVATAACQGDGGRAGDRTSTSHTALRTTAATAAANWAALARDLDGSLVRPGDASWATARQLYNTRFDALKPAAVAYVAHAADIRTVLSYARAHGVKV